MPSPLEYLSTSAASSRWPGAVNPLIPNLQALLQTLHEHKIYAIARLPLFWDEKLANARPEWGIKSKAKGGLWSDAYEHHWTNPRRPEVWAYNLAIAKEAAQRGFDEIQTTLPS